jgi:anaerobic magnesium-protoporphyrin IX monomethyl ester cyclase
MKILLVDILKTSLEDVWPSAEHSLGLMYLASSIKNNAGENVTIKIETLVSRSNRAERDQLNMTQLLESFHPDLVGIRCLTIGRDTLHHIAEVIKSWNNNCFVAAGGPYVTDDPEDALSCGFIDLVAIGEGEITFSNLVKRLIEKKSYFDINGIAYRDNGQVIKTPPQQLIADLDSIPFPSYDMVDLDKFSKQFLTFTSKISCKHANIMTTRGCPFHCLYCHNILGKQFRMRTPENVLSEIRFIYDKYGVTDFQIIDDIFNLDIDRAKKICDLIIQSGMKITLSFPNALRGDRVDRELIDKMHRAGTKFISYAIETASPRLQKLIKKNLNLDKISTAIEYTAQADIVTRGFFMLGFPTETEEEVNQTIEFAKSSSLCGATFFTVVYFPGTKLFKLAQTLGYFNDAPYSVQRDYVNVGEGPYDFSIETLTKLKMRAVKEFAFTRERVENALRILPDYFTQREIDGFFMAYVISSRASIEDIEDETVKKLMHRYFLIANKFSKKNEFYV